MYKVTNMPRMWRSILLLSAAMLFTACESDSNDDTPAGLSPDEQVNINVSLSGRQIVPAVTTEVTGTASITIDTQSGELEGSVTVSGLNESNSVTAIHIHQAVAGASGAIVVTLSQNGTNADQWDIPEPTTLDADDIASLLAAEMYFNVHTTDYGAGEIRGQIIPDGYQAIFTVFDGEQQVPAPVVSSGTASGYLTLNTSTGEVSAKLVTDLTVTAGHIHQGAAGTNGGIVFPLIQNANDAALWEVDDTLDSDTLAALDRGELYFNLHTSANASGELRGQILPAGIVMERVELTGEQQVPTPVVSVEEAIGFITVNTDSGDTVANVLISDTMDVTAMHIHLGYAGVSGGIVVTLTEDDTDATRWEAAATLSAEQLTAFESGELYFNVHTSTYTGGELRGQIVPESIEVVRTELDGSQQVPVVSTAATGIAYLTLNTDSGAVVAKLRLFDLTGATAAHIHEGTVGNTGGIVLTLVQNATDADLWEAANTLDATGLTAYENDELYYNVHTSTYASGEIRGQITH